MLTLILSAVTGGGLLGGVVLLFLKPALRATIGGVLGRIPPRVWWALLAMAAIFAVVLWHNHTVESARAAGRIAGRADAEKEWKAAFDTMQRAANDFRRAHDLRGERITTLLGERHAQNLADIAADADTLRLRGPGKAAAACTRPGGGAGLAGGTGAEGRAPAGPDAPGPGMPADERQAIVPWGWLVQRAEEHDALLSEVKTWRSWHDQQGQLQAAYVEQLRRALPEPAFGQPPP